ncbi:MULTISPECIES: efflux transporter outer membrane subunit [unclassified Xanthomonas]|uniref:efflux transporter outer membrane subunit n=1 Tax=unclassified Xanthomonas TaxID=2643310 RepID=UPI00288345DE|nr:MULTISPECIES: efflux transporter outer membrane subunit [unclassified Xanthomonas]
MRLSANIAYAMALLALGGCANLAPQYVRPPPRIPQQQTTSEHGFAPTAPSEVFASPRLRDTVALALERNQDLALAMLNVQRARASYRLRDAETLPTVTLDGNGVDASRQQGQLSVSLGFASYELDFFGRVKNLKEAALQDVLQSDENRRSASLSLIAEVATAWLRLDADQQRFALVNKTAGNLQRVYELTLARYNQGAISGLELAQSDTALAQIGTEQAGLEAQLQQDRNALTLLVGAEVPETLLPDADARGHAALSLNGPLPAGVPSSLLLRRPDVMAAEHALIGANADIGVARARFFPRIALTGSYGNTSTALSTLLGGGGWNIAASAAVPLFDHGANRANLKVTELDTQIAQAQYQKTLQIAFRDVADALAIGGSIAARLQAQTQLIDAASKQARIAAARYERGQTGLVDLLNAERALYAAQQALLDTTLLRDSNLVTAYRVLGGEWMQATTRGGSAL